MKLSLGEIPRTRAKRVLSALLSLANKKEHVEPHRKSFGDVKFVKSGQKQLTIKTTLKQLAALVNYFDKLNGDGEAELLSQWSLKEALEHLRLTLGIFFDIRHKRQGSKEWVFRLDLWFAIEDQAGNLDEFDRKWEIKKELLRTKLASKHNQVPFEVLLDVRNFVGRKAELEKLEKLLITDKTAISIVGIYGMGGVGKSTLAKHFAHQYRKSFPDGILFADFSAQEPAALLESFAGTYGCDLTSTKSILDKAVIIRSIFSKKRSLLILDNANDTEILSYLLPTGVCSVIVTSRDKDIVSLQGFEELILEPFIETESIDLLSKIIGKDKILSENIEAIKIAKLCGNLPLAISISGSLIKFSSCTLNEYRFSFEDEHKKLDILEWRTRSLRSSFNITWDLLDDTLKKLFSTLSIFGDSSVDIIALSVVLEKKPIKIQMEMGGLVAVSLVYVNDSKLYQLHPLLKEFATERLSERDYDEVFILHRRLAMYYLNLLQSGQLMYDQIKENYGNIIKIIYWTFDNYLYKEFVEFSKSIIDILLFKGYWNDGGEILRKTIIANQELRDLQTEFEMRLKLSELSREQANYHEAYDQYEACKVYFEKTGQKLKLASIIRELGELTRVRRDYIKARQLHRKSLRLYKKLGSRIGEAQVLHDLGLVERIFGNHAEAVELLQGSLLIHESLGEILGRAYNYLELGIIARLQQNKQAREFFTICYSGFEQSEDKRGLAYALRELGELAVEENNYAEAEELHQRSLQLRQELGDQRGKAISLYRLGRLSQLQKNYELSQRYYLESLAIAKKLDDKLHKAFNLVRLGELANLAGDKPTATENWEQSLKMFNEMRVADPEVSEVQNLLEMSILNE